MSCAAKRAAYSAANKAKWLKQNPYDGTFKACSLCKKHLPREMFGRAYTRKDGLKERCQECNKKSRIPEQVMLRNAKLRAKLNDLDFNITVDDIIIPKFCPVLGLLLQVNTRIEDNSPSLDRIVGKRGYVKGNVEVISYRANRLKSDATADELERIAEYMRAQL